MAKRIVAVYLSRFVGFTALAASIEAVLTHHIAYDSWQEPVLLLFAALSWTMADLIVADK